MKHHLSTRRVIAVATVLLLLAGYILWRNLALSAATDALRLEMKSGAIRMIEDRFTGPVDQKAFILSAIERTHTQAFERCPMERSFVPIGSTRGTPSATEVSINLIHYLHELHDEIHAEAIRLGMKFDATSLSHALGLRR